MSLDEILAAFAAHKISRRDAGTYLFALQIGELNLTRMEQLPPPDLGDPFHPHPETSGDHNSNGAPAPSAPPQVADCLLDHRDTEGTHEYDPERPFPLTPRKLRERRKSLEETLRGYREARAFYATMPQDDPNQRPPVVLAYLEKNIARVETELRFLNEQSIPDSP